MSDAPVHSALGASSAARWMACPGSHRLIQAIKPGTVLSSRESSFATEGTIAHAGIARCLRDGLDAWEIVGERLEEGVFTDTMSGPAQVMLDICRPLASIAKVTFLEHRIHDTDIHPLFYGTVDFAAVLGTADGDILVVVDYKHGAGVAVDVEDNAQTRYYTLGILRLSACANVQRVRRIIVQPRIGGDPIQQAEEEDAADLREWGRSVLRPAMVKAEAGGELTPGKHCQFCPAKLVCPALTATFRTMATVSPESVGMLTDAQLDQDYGLMQAVLHYQKALKTELLTRALRGNKFDNAKLVRAKADRIWKVGAEERLHEVLGDIIYTDPTLRSPAALEKADPRGKDLTKELAYSPDNGLSLAARSDRRVEVTVQPGEAVFAAREDF